MFTLLILRRPQNGFGGMGEIAAAQVGRRIGFFPRNVVEDFVAELLHGVADGKDDVMRAADPDGAVGFQNALAAFEPFGVEFVIKFRAARNIPVAFVHPDHFSGVATDAAVGKEIGRVGKDGVEAAFVAVFIINGVEEFEAVAMIKPQSVAGIMKN